MTFRPLLTTLLLAASLAQAAPPQATRQPPGAHHVPLGSFQITALSDGTVTIPLEELLTHTTPGHVKAVMARDFLPTQYETSINAYLVHTGSRLVLVDTGAGGLFGPTGGDLVASMKAAGYAPSDVDDVLLTHIHRDHSGGLTVDGKAVFPNATVWVDRHEADHWFGAKTSGASDGHDHGGTKEAEDSLRPYRESGRLKTFDAPAQVVPGIRAEPARGHTPGHSLYVAESRGERIVFWGDLLHISHVQFGEPSITIKFDLDSPAAARQRKAWFADAAKRGDLIAAAHISFPGIGRIAPAGQGYRWVPLNYTTAVKKP